MKTIETKNTKKGNTVYFMVDENGKKRQVSRKTAQAIIASDTDNHEVWELIPSLDELNDVTEDEPVIIDTAETDGSEEDADEEFTIDVMPAEDDDADDDELVDPPAPKTKKTRKKTTAEEHQQKWLENAKTDENGKYYIVPELTYKGMELHKGWNPCFYIVTNDLKVRRIGLKFAIELAKADKAVEISKGGVKELKKAA